MNPSLVVLLDCLEDIKTKISDNEYKIMIEELQKINNNVQNTKKYEIVVTYYRSGMRDKIFINDECLEVNITKKKQTMIRSAEFDNFCRSDETSRIFKYNKELLEKLLYEYDFDDNDDIVKYSNWIMYFTILKID